MDSRSQFLEMIKESWEANSTLGDPKPIIMCPDCGLDLIVCWGDVIVNPYVRHKVESTCRIGGSGGGGESFDHAKAKRMLKDFLEEGGVIVTRIGCAIHAMDIYLETKSPVRLEVGVGDCVFDVYWDDKGSKFGIEVYHSHRANEHIRKGICWIEVAAAEVIDRLYESKDDQIRLTNIRSYCEACEVPTPPSTLIPSSSPSTPTPLTPSPWGKKYICGFHEDGLALACEAGYASYEDESMISPATLAIAELRGYRVIARVEWYGPDGEEISDTVRNKLDNTRRCLKCWRKSDRETSKYPLCTDCYRKDQNGQGKYEERYHEYGKVREEVQQEIRSFLKAIPGTWGSGVKCKKCNRDWLVVIPTKAESEYSDMPCQINNYVYWNRRKIPVCHVCLGRQFRKYYR